MHIVKIIIFAIDTAKGLNARNTLVTQPDGWEHSRTHNALNNNQLTLWDTFFIRLAMKFNVDVYLLTTFKSYKKNYKRKIKSIY